MKGRVFMAVAAWCLSGACLLFAVAAYHKTPNAPPPPAPLPEDLAAVPADALAFIHVRVADLWNSPSFRFVQRQADPKMLEAAQRAMEKEMGLNWLDIEQATVVFTLNQNPRRDPESFFIVLTRTPVNQEKFLKAVVPQAQKEEATGIYTSLARQQVAVRFLSDKLIVIGSREAVQRQAQGRSRADGPLSRALNEAAQQHYLVAGFQMPRELSAHLREEWGTRGRWRHDPMEMMVADWILDVQHGMLVVDANYNATVKAELTFGGEWQAKRAHRAVHAGVLMLQALCKLTQEEVAELRPFVQLLTTLEHALDDTNVELQGTTVRASVQVKFPPAILDQAALEGFQMLDLPDDRQERMAPLRQLGMAMHNYHGDFDRLPSHAIYSKEGKPLLSWRVALLPYLGLDNLYRQFRLDEPWDSEHNKKLMAQMPKVFELPGSNAPAGHTYFQVPVTPPDYRGIYRTIFAQAPRNQMTLGQLSVQDGTSNTIMILEAAKSVPWSAPEDMVLPADDQSLPKFGANPASGKFMVCYGDGSVRFLLTTAAPETYQRLLRQMIGRSDGQLDDYSVLYDPTEERSSRRRFGGHGRGRSTFSGVASTLPVPYSPTAPYGTVKSPTIRLPQGTVKSPTIRRPPPDRMEPPIRSTGTSSRPPNR
jgi:hypothetical protein